MRPDLRTLMVAVCVLMCVVVASGAKAGTRRARTPEPTAETVFERGLVKKRVSPLSILREYARPSTQRELRHTEATVLAYVTPWNRDGYEMAVRYRAKLDMVSPTWFSVAREGDKGFKLDGAHNVDARWIARLREGTDSAPRVVPRLAFDGFGLAEFSALFSSDAASDRLVSLLVSTLGRHSLDGAVLDMGGLTLRHLDGAMLPFIERLSLALGAHEMRLVLVVPPRGVTVADTTALAPLVDAFSVMTYDFSNAGRPGPNAPLPWMRTVVSGMTPSADTAHKMLMGLNFYGNHYWGQGQGGPIVGHEYRSLLREHRKAKPQLRWEKQSQEHVIRFNANREDHLIYYPTLLSLQRRLELASELGVGISIWEIGQGLEYFFDLL